MSLEFCRSKLQISINLRSQSFQFYLQLTRMRLTTRYNHEHSRCKPVSKETVYFKFRCKNQKACWTSKNFILRWTDFCKFFAICFILSVKWVQSNKANNFKHCSLSTSNINRGYVAPLSSAYLVNRHPLHQNSCPSIIIRNLEL